MIVITIHAELRECLKSSILDPSKNAGQNAKIITTLNFFSFSLEMIQLTVLAGINLFGCISSEKPRAVRHSVINQKIK